MKENNRKSENKASSGKELIRSTKKEDNKNEIDITFSIGTPEMKAISAKKRKNDVLRKKRNDSETVKLDPYEMANYKNVRIVTTKKKNKGRFPFSTLMAVLALTGMLLFLMMNYAELDRANSEMANMRLELTHLKNTEERLTKQLDERDDLTVVEGYAKSHEMIKKDELPGNANTITIVKNDEGKVTEYGTKDENKVLFLLSGIGRVVSNFFGA